MPTTFPTSVQTFTAPTANNSQNSEPAVAHHSLHGTVNDTIVAVQGAVFGRRSIFEFGAAVNGDIAAALTAAMAANVKRLRIPAGNWTLSAAREIGDMVLEGDGPSTVISATAATGAAAITSTGSIVQIQNLSASPAVGAKTVTFASAPSLSVGDIFVIHNATNSSWSGFRTNYRAGEWCEVESIAGSVVTLKNPLFDAYTFGAVTVHRLVPKTPTIRDMRIIGAASEAVVAFALCKSALLDHVIIEHTNNACINIDRCIYTTVRDCSVNNIGDGGDDYGMSIHGAHSVVIGGSFYGRRHAIATGGNNEIGSCTSRDLRIIGATLKNDIDSGVEAADMHGNTEFSGFQSCAIYGGANLQGKDNFLRDCHITHRSDGVVVAFAEVKGGEFSIDRCTLVTAVDPSAGSRGIIDIGGNSSTAVNASTTLETTLSVTNCKLIATNQSAITSFVTFVNRGTTAAVNFQIDNNNFRANLLGQILYTGQVTGTAASNFIIVDRVQRAPSGCALHNANASTYLNFPHRLQTQSGIYQGTTAASGGVISGAINFRYQYPRFPNMQIVRSGRNGGASGVLSNRMGIPYVYELTGTYVRPAINTEDNTSFTGGTTFDLHWRASIDEV
jgi:hypothetical protein